ncbi:hypothetical protein HUT18_14285 [Streptomyces sp. NA04227]|uniref:hypothetical protein n=1 Tax=Streptomyces sp. NA04227 TaxID=2742136 RepID=UPI00159186DE|nr:hypothetical protein [Streptomyces sp. NA04227]QKW07381.1 hypothetical protein HUT18_14285 [Streptomyces sp. NA04227]
MGWVLDQARGRQPGTEPNREFWLRKAALLDRVALEEEATYSAQVAAKAVAVAEEAARKFVEYDVAHFGLSRRGEELSTGADWREYVRQAYRAWRRAQQI